MPLHSTLTGADLHETKGAATATSSQYLTANGDGTATFKTIPVASIGWWDHNDLTTQTTPINLAVANTRYDLTNDAAGPATNLTYGFTGINIWNNSTNRLKAKR